MQCCDSPFEENSFSLDFKILSCNLNKVNIILFVILFLRFVYDWLDRVFSQERKPNLFHKILATLLAIPFCFFWGLPTLLWISFFFTCNYYPYTTTVLLSFFFLPWIFSKFSSFRCEAMDPPGEQSSKRYEMIHQEIEADMQRADDSLQSWQIQSLQVSDSLPETPSSAHLNPIGETPLYSENHTHSLRPLYFSTESLEDVPQMSENQAASLGCGSTFSMNVATIPSTSSMSNASVHSTSSTNDTRVPSILSTNDATNVPSISSTNDASSVPSISSTNDASSIPSTSSMNDAIVPSTSSANDAAASTTKSTTNVRRKRRKTRVVNFHKPKKRKKRPATQAK